MTALYVVLVVAWLGVVAGVAYTMGRQDGFVEGLKKAQKDEL